MTTYGSGTYGSGTYGNPLAGQGPVRDLVARAGRMIARWLSGRPQ